jgi:hypothetical protein
MRIGSKSVLLAAFFFSMLCLALGWQHAHAQQQSAQPDPCPRTKLADFAHARAGEERTVSIWQIPSTPAIYFVAGMAIDADGAPNAYNPQNTGVDDLENAGEPGSWHALAKDESGEPILQGPADPFPGYYVSTTALSDHSKSDHDPAKYVDAEKIPYIVLPVGMNRELGARPGDFAFIQNLKNGKTSFAIFADVGPRDLIGEGSIALAENIGVRSSPRRGGTSSGILYVIFAGSGNHQPRPVDEINSEGARLLHDFGGLERLRACSDVGATPAKP